MIPSGLARPSLSPFKNARDSSPDIAKYVGICHLPADSPGHRSMCQSPLQDVSPPVRHPPVQLVTPPYQVPAHMMESWSAPAFVASRAVAGFRRQERTPDFDIVQQGSPSLPGPSTVQALHGNQCLAHA